MTLLPVRINWPGALAWAALAVAAPGCASPLVTSYWSGSRRGEAGAKPLAAPTSYDSAAAKHDPRAAALRKATGQQPTSPDQALASVLDELREINAIDPAAQQELLADLKAAKPEHYGIIVEQFQAALAYRQQLAEREAKREHDEAALAAEPAEPATPVVIASGTAEAASAGGTAVQLASRGTIAPPPARTVARVISPPPEEAPATARAAAGTHRDPLVELAAASSSAPPVDPAVSPGSQGALSEGQQGPWRAELEGAIAALERSVHPQPSTVDELHDHMRLRALLLVAGREEEAYKPIPGASPAQQDYWSKQLFAMSAYLNSAGMLDDKRRAAAALVHLDEARSALTQLATLQVRGLAFVKSVEGYGAYEPLKHAEFRPGDPVTLYAEVENFASKSTPEGYETVLATSYQVLDSSGRRIEGAQFPDVSDICRGRRRDFHLQYGVTLPTHISPGPYQLELTITDQRSGKIGVSTAPFEINAP